MKIVFGGKQSVGSLTKHVNTDIHVIIIGLAINNNSTIYKGALIIHAQII